MKRWWWFTATLFVLALATAAAAQENLLVLYGSPDRDWVAAVASKFEKDTGIKVQWIRASSNEMYARIEAEKANPKGDVWFGGTGDPHFDAAEKGLTEPHCTPKMAELREWMRDPIGGCRTIGLYAGPLGWAVNKDYRSFQLQSNRKTPLPAVVLKHGMDFESVKTIKYDFMWASKNRERILKHWTEQIFSQAR